MIIRRRGWLLGVCLLLALIVIPNPAFAEVQYDTNTKDSFGRIVWLQPTYYPIGMLGTDLVVQDAKDASKQTASSLNAPKGLFIDEKDEIYVVDTGNNRIVHLNKEGKWIRYIVPSKETKPFNKPEGIFVDKTGDMYVADTGNKRVVKLDKDGKLLKEYVQPKSTYIPSSYKFDPIKIVVDKRGFLYIATLGGYQGLLQLTPDGKFQSFFGANATAFSALDALKRTFYTKEMYAKEISKLPGSINSVAIDAEGFIYTVSGGNITSDQLKKLNIKGDNLLASTNEFGKAASKSYGEYKPWQFRTANGKGVYPQLLDVAADKNGNIAVIDSQYKTITHYDSVGNLLYFWGGVSSANATQLGLLKNAVAVAFNSNNDMYVLDSTDNVVQVFRLSEFGQRIDQANLLTLEGRYEESKSKWLDIIRLNALFGPAIEGVAKAEFKEENYAMAAKLFKQAGNQDGYSDSKWQLRLQWFQKNFSLLATLLLILAIAFTVLDKATKKRRFRNKEHNRKRKQNQLIVELKHAFYILKHPIDGFTALRFESKGSYVSAIVILIVVFGSLLLKEFYTSFSFNKVIANQISVMSVFIQFFGVWIAWVISNYLISSIYRGEGRFRDVFIGSAYALLPFIIVGIPVAVISNAMTLSEQSIYSFLETGTLIWVALLFFWKVQSLQNYSVGETVLNGLMSIFAMILIGVMLFIIVGLTSDLYTFIYEIYQEVKLR